MVSHGERMSRILASYDDWIVRGYCWGRFKILRQRFLLEIGQYMPEVGSVLDVGCGFGLFALYFSLEKPGLRLEGIDLDERRIELARRAARRLGLEAARFDVARAEQLRLGERRFDGIYTLDLIHHLPRAAVRPLLEAFHAAIAPGGRLVVKDVDTRPAYKRLFTHALDLAMDPARPPHYWPSAELAALLREVGFRVYHHTMNDYLPYPHMLYVCEKLPV